MIHIRPLLRDRSWGHSEHILCDSTTIPNFETDNRPMSAKHHVQRLGLHVEQGGRCSSDSASFESARENILPPRISAEAAEVESKARPAEWRKLRKELCRTSLRVAFQRDSTGDTESWYEGDRAISPKTPFKLADQEEHDLGLCHAYGTINSSRGMSGRYNDREEYEGEDTNCEVRVSNGVAVTEEAVDLGTADIIMQV